MKLPIITGLLSLTLSCTFAVPDTIKVNARLFNLENKLKSTNDSLRRELLYYKVKDDYYATALSKQSTEFATIIGAIIGLSALLGFGWYRNLVSKVNQGESYINTQAEALRGEIEIAVQSLANNQLRQEIDFLQSVELLYQNVSNLYILNDNNLINTIPHEDPNVKATLLALIKDLFRLRVQFLVLENTIAQREINIKYTSSSYTNTIVHCTTLLHSIIKKVKSLDPTDKELEEGFEELGFDKDLVIRIINKNKKGDLLLQLAELNLLYKQLFKL